MNQTVIQYGDELKILKCQTRRFEQEIVRDPSGSDSEFTKFTIAVDGWLRVSGSTGANLASSVRIEPSNFVRIQDQRDALLAILQTPGQDFKYYHSAAEDGTLADPADVVIDAVAGTKVPDLDTEDVNNGPRCLSADLTAVMGGTLYKCVATFEVCRVQCVDAEDLPVGEEANNTGILTNKWSVRDSIDQNFYTTRTYTGRLRVANAKLNANFLRPYVMPVLAAGLRRQTCDFMVSEDGLQLNWTVIDKEAAFSAPTPATSWTLTQSEHTGDGKISTGAIKIDLMGDRNVNKKSLIEVAISCLEDRLGMAFPNADKNTVFLEDIGITDTISSDQPASIGLSCQYRHIREAEDGGPDKNLVFVANTLGKPIDPLIFAGGPAAGYDDNVSPTLPGGDGETRSAGVSGAVSLLGAYITYLQNPCYKRHGTTENNVAVAESEIVDTPTPFRNPPTVSGRSVPTLPDELPTWASVQHSTAMYTDYRIESVWKSDENRIQLPIASSSGSGYSSTQTAALVKLGRGVTKRIIRVHAERLNEAPLIQEPEDEITVVSGGTTKIAKLMKRNVRTPREEHTINGSVLIAVDAEFIYGLDTIIENADNLKTGIDPSETGSVVELDGGAFSTIQESSTIS